MFGSVGDNGVDVLVATGVSHGFGTTHVLRNIDLHLQQGEVLALLGPSGSGKSTLLHLLGGLETPVSGNVLWDGKNLKHLSKKEQDALRNTFLGLVFQQHYLLADLDVLNNVLVPAMIAGKNHKQRALEVLERVGLSHRLNHYPEMLSGGERQRVAVARAVLMQPKVILADEPTGNLDRKNSLEVMSMLVTLAKEQGSSVLLVTHDELLAQRADRTIHMLDGCILPPAQS